MAFTISSVLKPRKRSIIFAFLTYIIIAAAWGGRQYYEYVRYCKNGICSAPAWVIIPYTLVMCLPVLVVAYVGCGIILTAAGKGKS